MDWQPIETAPTNGSRVDLWVCADDVSNGTRVTSCRMIGGVWVSLCDGGFEPVARYARITHWMPLPEPPSDR